MEDLDEKVGSHASSASTPPPLTLRGLLEKRSSDGSWKTQLFSLKRSKLYYHEPSQNDRVASLDLANVVKVERSGLKLLLFVDEKRKHQLRALQVDSVQGPSLDDWEDAIVQHIHAARYKRPPCPQRSSEEPPPPQTPPQTKTIHSHEDQKAHYRRLIVDFYQRTNPEKVASVDTLIAKYHDIGVSEADLLAAIQNKYEKIQMLK